MRYPKCNICNRSRQRATVAAYLLIGAAMARAGGDVAVRLPDVRPIRGVVVLCPGQNGDARERINEREWGDFTDRVGLALAGIFFHSKDSELAARQGYFNAQDGSGEKLLAALDEHGLQGLPMYLIGFSGGAHFAISFAAWRPDLVGGFCAQAFAWWPPPPRALQCPAIIACGDRDGSRYGSTYAYFQAGRRNGAPWIWVSLRDRGHFPSPELEEFFRRAIQCLDRKERGRIAADNATGRKVKGTPCAITSSELPAWELWGPWRELHRP